MDPATAYESHEVPGDVPGGEDLLYVPAMQQWEKRTQQMRASSVEDHEPATFIGRVAVPVKDISIKAIEASKTYMISVVKDPVEHKKGIATGTVITVAGLMALSKSLHSRRKR